MSRMSQTWRNEEECSFSQPCKTAHFVKLGHCEAKQDLLLWQLRTVREYTRQHQGYVRLDEQSSILRSKIDRRGGLTSKTQVSAMTRRSGLVRTHLWCLWENEPWWLSVKRCVGRKLPTANTSQKLQVWRGPEKRDICLWNHENRDFRGFGQKMALLSQIPQKPGFLGFPGFPKRGGPKSTVFSNHFWESLRNPVPQN